jgi:hypothetical protein
VSNADWEPEHHTIITLDIEGFGSPTRTDPIRAGIRSALESLISAAAADLRRSDPIHAAGDTGDGKWLLFSVAVPKTVVLSGFVKSIETGLRHHNAAASTAAQIRLRIGVHHGDLIPDDGGYSGEPLNHTFRIIDNDVARQALKATRHHSVVVVSADFFEKIVRPGYGSLDPEDFLPVPLRVKELATTAWISRSADLDASVLTGGHTTDSAQSTPFRSHAPPRSQQVLTLADLPPTSLDVAISDIHNGSLYGRGHPEVPVQQHFETALLLGEKAVVHCADAYRSTEVSDILGTFEPCIESGDLLFLLGENAQNPGHHFRGYIDHKVTQYQKSQYGGRDVASLTQVTDDAADRAEFFLTLSPYALIRGFSGTDRFIHSAKHELQLGERITIHEHFLTSMLGRLGLSIRQLLELTRLGPDGHLVRTVVDEATVDRLQTEVNWLASHNSFSRQIFMESIRRVTSLAYDDPLDYVLEERISTVHLLSTLGSLRHLEVSSRRDRASTHYYGHLLEHLSVLSEVPHPSCFGAELVMELRSLPCWWHFAAYHLRLVGDMTRRLELSDQPGDLPTAYRRTRRIPEFDPIRSVVRSHWL